MSLTIIKVYHCQSYFHTFLKCHLIFIFTKKHKFQVYCAKPFLCALSDCHKAFYTLNIAALWRKLLCNNIDGKIFNVIFMKILILV